MRKPMVHKKLIKPGDIDFRFAEFTVRINDGAFESDSDASNVDCAGIQHEFFDRNRYYGDFHLEVEYWPVYGSHRGIHVSCRLGDCTCEAPISDPNEYFDAWKNAVTEMASRLNEFLTQEKTFVYFRGDEKTESIHVIYH